jgi:uncharacterized protein YndB with AHSA1/START domain
MPARPFALTALLVAAPLAAARAERSLHHETVVDAPIDGVWAAFTTKEGTESWMVAQAEIDLRVGGTMRTHYDPKGKLGDPNTIVNEILSFEPRRMLSLRAVKAPENTVAARIMALGSTWSVIRLEAAAPDRTRVHVSSYGWGEGPEWDEAYRFFEKGNAWTLERLRQKFARPDAGKRDADVLARLSSLAGGEWIFENAREDGGVFRGRSVVEAGPDGHSLLMKGWLGDSRGMFFHALTQVFREPKTGAARFLNVNETGAVTEGGIWLAEPNRLVWNWQATALDGARTDYRVEMVFDKPDEYIFRLFNASAGDERPPIVTTRWRRVAEAPEVFRKLRSEN